MTKNKIFMIGLCSFVLAGCASDGTYYRSDTYQATAVNQAQQVRTVEVLAIGSAKIAVDNRNSRQDAGNVGMIIGAIAGAAIGNHGHHNTTSRVLGGLAGGALGSMAGKATGGSSTHYVDGVQLTFRYKDKIYNSAQVGQPCEYKTGLAVMVSTSPTETRIQPNNPGACTK